MAAIPSWHFKKTEEKGEEKAKRSDKESDIKIEEGGRERKRFKDRGSGV